MAGEEICPVAEAAKLLGDKWTIIVLRNLADGPKRFSHLERSGEGISPSMLASRLRELEEHGLISRTSYHEIPPRVEYALTTMGRDSLPIIEALRLFGARWLIPASEPAPCSPAPPTRETEARGRLEQERCKRES